MKPVETLHLLLSPLDLESAGGSLRLGERRRRFGHLEPVSGQAEGIPAETQPGENDQAQPQNPDQTQCPTPRGQDPQHWRDLQGNTFRSSSKWGPSLKLLQSPPQTIAVPCRTAAALNAAAMRGYRGQSQRTCPSTRAATSTA